MSKTDSDTRARGTVPVEKAATVPDTAPARGSDQLAQAWFGSQRKLTRQSLRELVDLARKSGGEVVNVAAAGAAADADDWCGTMWFKGPRPKVGTLVDSLTQRGFGVEIFPRGIINPDALEVIVRSRLPR